MLPKYGECMMPLSTDTMMRPKSAIIDSERFILGEVRELMELPIVHPSVDKSKIHKSFLVTNGEITDEAIAQLQIGLHLVIKKETILTKPCKAWKINEPHFEERYPPTRAGHHRPYSWLAIVLYEGKFRQVRKMTAAVGFPTLRLVRVRIGDIRLDDMKTGEVRPMETLI
jgi:23S rRNA pseudouridine2457 synthase